MREIKIADMNDFENAYTFIKALWSYRNYDKAEVFEVYKKIIEDDTTFMFFVKENDEYIGFCHGDFFQTLWMAGLTCYVSGLITRDDQRGSGVGTMMLDHVKKISKEKGCKALTLESGLPRVKAHEFYEKYGFEKGCYGFEMLL